MLVMKRKMVSALTLTLLFIGMLTLAFNIQPVKAEFSEPPDTEWNKTYGGTDYDSPYSVVQTNDKGYAIAGYTYSFGTGSYDLWLVKTDASGNMQWNRTYGGTGGEEADSVVQTTDGGYALAGSTDSFGAGGVDVWLVKTDWAGNMQWNKTYGGASSDWASSVVQTSDGGYAIAGETYSFGAGDGDFWLVKTDSAGTMQWNKRYDRTPFEITFYSDSAFSVVQTSDGGYAIAGGTGPFALPDVDFWLVKTDAAGTMQWNKRYGGTNWDVAYSVVQTSDGGYAIAGVTESFGAGYKDFWLVKTDSAGTMQWNKTYGEGSWDAAHSVVQTNDEGYALVGETLSYRPERSHFDFWLVKADENGNMQWNKTYGGTDDDRAYSVVQTSDGGYAIAGGTESFGAGHGDFWLIKLAGLSATISPLSASTLVDQSVTFTSTVSGGYTPYSYKWYLNGNPVSGATSASWTFTPTTSGIYYIHLKVTDAKANTAQSDTARITVATVPVGGYSFPIQVTTKAEPVLPYIALIATLTAILTKLRPKTKRKH